MKKTGKTQMILQLREQFSAYMSLMKPTIVLMFVVTGVASIALEGSLMADPTRFVFLAIAIAVTAGSANALNMYFDRDIDALMQRTRKRRPLPMQKIPPLHALTFGFVSGFGAIAYLGFAFNWLAAFLSFFTIGFYVCVYTLWLKRRTPYNIVIGGAAGSTAPLIGWAAATGSISGVAWVLFLIVFLWTPPHFWALAIALQDEYRGAGVPMLPVTHGEKRTRLEIFWYTILLLPVTFAPYFLGSVGKIYLGSAVALNITYVFLTVKLLGTKERSDSKKLFWFSILYLFLLFGAVFADISLR